MTTDVESALRRLAGGDDGALHDLYPLIYSDLRRVARGQLVRERPDHTLNTTALVHESYLRLAGSDPIAAEGRSHFLSIAARAMRRILVEHARRRGAQKRGKGVAFVELDPSLAAAVQSSPDLLALDEALERLALLDDRQARVVEYRVFGGMTVPETAEILQVSAATVKRDWTMARAWLNRELGAG